MTDKTRLEFEEWIKGSALTQDLARMPKSESGLEDIYLNPDANLAFFAWLAAKEKYEPKISGYGCHCDLEPNQSPDGCVIDEGRINDCVYAKILSKEGKVRDDCEYWQPIREPSTQGGGE